MELLTHFDTYINAQKNVAIQFIVIGVGLIVMALCLQIFGKSNLSNGLKAGALICGLFIIIGGFAYNNTENKLRKTQISLYQKSEKDFQQVEKERMQKVVKDYPIYQAVGASLIVLALLVILFVKKPFWQGVAFAVIIYSVGFLLVEAHSHQSIKTYFDLLKRQ